MKLTNRLKIAVTLGAFAAIPIALHLDNLMATAQGTSGQKPAQTETAKPVATVYSYIAQSGDGYAHMARKAVQTYGKKTKSNLTQAGIIFAETNLTNVAGSPRLEVTQKVDIAETLVKDWADKSTKLTKEEQAAWQQYVAGVDFNTDSVGRNK